MKLTQEQIDCVVGLEDDLNRLTPDRVLQEARRKDSPLHGLSVFDEWDKNKAAHNHWLDCCREIIGAVKIQVTVNEVELVAPRYVRDPEIKGNEQGYRACFAIARDPVTARVALIAELNRAASVVTRARDIAAALNLTDEVDGMLAQIVGLQTRLVDQERELAKAS